LVDSRYAAPPAVVDPSEGLVQESHPVPMPTMVVVGGQEAQVVVGVRWDGPASSTSKVSMTRPAPSPSRSSQSCSSATSSNIVELDGSRGDPHRGRPAVVEQPRPRRGRSRCGRRSPRTRSWRRRSGTRPAPDRIGRETRWPGASVTARSSPSACLPPRPSALRPSDRPLWHELRNPEPGSEELSRCARPLLQAHGWGRGRHRGGPPRPVRTRRHRQTPRRTP